MAKKKFEEIGEVMTGISPEDITATRKDARLNIRVTDAEKDEMTEAAKSLKVSLSEYLTALHQYAWPRLRNPKRRK